MAKDMKLNGQTFKNPSEFSISHYNLTKAGRTANGKMTLDLVAKKRKFFFTYEVISGKDLEHIMSIIDSNQLFFTLQYTENDIVKTARVYVGEIPRDRFRTGKVNEGWYWQNFNFNLIEQ